MLLSNYLGLKSTFTRAKFFVLDKLRRWNTITRNCLVVNLGYILFRYLGIPMHFRKLKNVDWRIVEEKFEKKLSSWKGKHMSVGGRLVLINSVLTSLAMFMLSFFKVPKQVLERLDYYRSRFFW